MNSHKLDILLISPSTMPLYQQEQLLSKSNTNLRPNFETPTGLLELASFTRNKLDYLNYELLDLAQLLYSFYLNLDQESSTTYEKYIFKMLDNVKMIPDVVAVSILFSSAYMSSLKLAETIKIKWPKTMVLFGGGHVTFYHDLVFRDSKHVDYVFVGEAELSFLAFLKQLRSLKLEDKKSMDTSSILGLYDKQKVENEKSQGVTKGAFGEMLIDLDEIGLPAFDLLNLDAYRSYSNSYTTGSIGMMMDRGCPFNCTYCASMVIHGAKIRSKSNKRIIADLKYLKEQCGFVNIVLWDDLLAAKKKKFIELTKQINEEKINEGLLFSMPSGLSVKVMNEELLDAVCSLGFDYIRIMIESGCEYAQEHIVKKRVDLNKARRLIAYARTLNVKVETNILFGFPRETKAHMQETIDYIKTIDVDWIQVFALLPLPGTEAYHEFVNMGKIDPADINWDTCGYSSREFDTEDITAKELTELVYDVNIYTNFFQNRNMLNKRYERAIMYFTDMVLWKYKFHIPALYQRAKAYQEIGKKDEAQSDLDEAIKQIKSSPIARKLWDMYGSEMPILNEYLDESYIKTVLPHPPSVNAGFKL